MKDLNSLIETGEKIVDMVTTLASFVPTAISLISSCKRKPTGGSADLHGRINRAWARNRHGNMM